MTDTANPIASSLRIDYPAPRFTATSTKGEIDFADYSGRWVALVFTPVCSTEFVAFARSAADFEALGVQLIGLSRENVHSHIAWAGAIEQHLDLKIDFPVVADPSRKVASAYGMIHPRAGGSATVRAVFIIDPDQVIRAVVHQPLTAGRGLVEIKRLVQALQAATGKRQTTPEGWKPGDTTIIPAPTSTTDAEKRTASAALEVAERSFARTRPALTASVMR